MKKLLLTGACLVGTLFAGSAMANGVHIHNVTISAVHVNIEFTDSTGCPSSSQTIPAGAKDVQMGWSSKCQVKDIAYCVKTAQGGAADVGCSNAYPGRILVSSGFIGTLNNQKSGRPITDITGTDSSDLHVSIRRH